jgi:hypothetical protein
MLGKQTSWPCDNSPLCNLAAAVGMLLMPGINALQMPCSAGSCRQLHSQCRHKEYQQQRLVPLELRGATL